MDLGKQIQEARIKKSWSRANLAAAIGVTPEYIRLIEHGDRNLSLVRLRSISKILDVELSEDSVKLTSGRGASEVKNDRFYIVKDDELIEVLSYRSLGPFSEAAVLDNMI